MIPGQDPSVRADEDISCLRPRGQRDWLQEIQIEELCWMKSCYALRELKFF
jgi:hypothetical protein